MSKLDNNDSIQNTVIRGGFCVGCGACSVIKGSNYRIALDDYGRYQAIINNNHKTNINEGDILKVCPFSGVGQDENQLSETLFDKSMPVDKGIGKYLSLYAGYVAEDNYRATGSSGGIVTWMLIQLLHSHKIDAAIHVTQNSSSDNNESVLFKYSISRCEEEIKNGAKSRYYPVEMSSVLKRVLDEPGRYAIVGVPCFIKAVRLLMQNNEILNERIAFCISLVCGHLKSTRFAELMATQMYDNDI
jgi:coenzyme F420 hydrogenase subunit beta